MLLSPPLPTVPAGLCFQFVQLAARSDEEIVAFAQRWGPLGLEIRAEERIEDWRRYAALGGALLRFAGDRATGGHGSDEDWRVICESTPPGFTERNQLTTAQQTAITALSVNTWFARARGHRLLKLVGNDLQVQPAASHLFGALITEIAHVIARTDQMAICAGCRNPFTPKRPISRGSRQYCTRCRNARVPQRDAARDYRRRTNPKE
jgi:hypothetical protein